MEGLYRKEVKLLEEEYFRWRYNYESLYPNGMKCSDGTHISLEEILEKCVYVGLKRDMEKLDKIYAKVKGRTHYWIGINPPPENYDLKKINDKMESCVNKYIMFQPGNYLYTIEQNTENGIRPHIHLFLLTKHRPNRIITNLAKEFNMQPNFIEVKTYRNNTLWEEHINYITGNKQDSKLELVKQDDIDREQLGIPKYFGYLETDTKDELSKNK